MLQVPSVKEIRLVASALSYAQDAGGIRVSNSDGARTPGKADHSALTPTLPVDTVEVGTLFGLCHAWSKPCRLCCARPV